MVVVSSIGGGCCCCCWLWCCCYYCCCYLCLLSYFFAQFLVGVWGHRCFLFLDKRSFLWVNSAGSSKKKRERETQANCCCYLFACYYFLLTSPESLWTNKQRYFFIWRTTLSMQCLKRVFFTYKPTNEHQDNKSSWRNLSILEPRQSLLVRRLVVAT